MTSSNVLIPLIKSYYADLLNPQEYHRLMDLETISEVLEVLMNTKYHEVLNINTLHRDEVERKLKQYHQKRLWRLSTFVFGDIKDFMYLFLLRDDLNNFIKAVTAKYNIYHFFDSRLMIDYTDNLENILTKIRHTQVYNLVNHALESNTFEELTAKVDDFYFNYVFSQITKLYKGHLRNSILMGLRDWVVVHNLKLIYRLKKYDIEVREDALVYIKGDPINSVTNKLREIPLSEFKNTKYFSSSIDKDINILVEHIDSIYKLNYSKKKMLTSTNVEELFLGIFLMSKIEINNVVHIIEGKRYKLNAQSLDPLLVY